MDSALAFGMSGKRFAVGNLSLRACLVLCACLLATAAASLQVRQNIENEAINRFAFVCDRISFRIQERLNAYALILRGGAAHFAASENVSRSQWRAYVETLRAAASIPGVQGLGYVQRILPHRLAAHIARVRSEGFPDYTVRPAGERAITTAIIYLEPFRDGNPRVFGFDMYSEPVRRAAMEQARDSGDAALSGRVMLQESEDQGQAGVLMYVPVYRKGMARGTLEQRRAALIG